jgi:hypothetical protein
MKTTTKLALASITAVLFTGGAFANDAERNAIDNHHGVVTYYARPAQQQHEATVAVFTGGKAVRRPQAKVERDALAFKEVSTPHGTISYFAPAE